MRAPYAAYLEMGPESVGVLLQGVCVSFCLCVGVCGKERLEHAFYLLTYEYTGNACTVGSCRRCVDTDTRVE